MVSTLNETIRLKASKQYIAERKLGTIRHVVCQCPDCQTKRLEQEETQRVQRVLETWKPRT